MPAPLPRIMKPSPPFGGEGFIMRGKRPAYLLALMGRARHVIRAVSGARREAGVRSHSGLSFVAELSGNGCGPEASVTPKRRHTFTREFSALAYAHGT